MKKAEVTGVVFRCYGCRHYNLKFDTPYCLKGHSKRGLECEDDEPFEY